NTGDSFAQYRAGLVYMIPVGVDKDARIAIEWFEKAAEQGIVEASFQLAYIYHHNDELKDLEKAVELYTHAGELGHTESSYALASYFGLIKDVNERIKWYKKAAELGHVKAQNELGEIYREGSISRRLFYQDTDVKADIN